MMMKMTVLATLLTTVTIVPTAQAQVNVKSLEDGRLQVTHYRGRPPFQRQVINEDDARYEEFAALVDFEPYVATTVEARQTGKSLSPERFRINQAPGDEVVEFARFEEVEEERRIRRSGPPGKSLFFR